MVTFLKIRFGIFLEFLLLCACSPPSPQFHSIATTSQGLPSNQVPPNPGFEPGSPTTIARGTTFYLQLNGNVNLAQKAQVYDIDLYDTPTEVIQNLKASGHIVICYFSAGTYEDWRDDAVLFPKSAIGKSLSEWPGESWVDIRDETVRTILANRIDLAQKKGCDGVDPDNVDGFTHDTNFALTESAELEFTNWLADQAHARGLRIGLKNALDLVPHLAAKYDFSVNEQCHEYNECGQLNPFLKLGKAVFVVEYTKYNAKSCSAANLSGLTLGFYNLDLNGLLFNPCF